MLAECLDWQRAGSSLTLPRPRAMLLHEALLEKAEECESVLAPGH